MGSRTFRHAITRRPCERFALGLTTSSLGPPDYDLMIRQHAAYVAALASFGLEVIELDPEERFPDAHFVEDTAVVTPEIAVVTRPGAEARRGEETSIEPVLARFRKTKRIEAPGTLDGGDVLVVGKRCFVGISERTNREGARALAAILDEHAYRTTFIEVMAGLHLKSSLNFVGDETFLVTEAFAGAPEIDGWRRIVVPRGEEYAANVLFVNGSLLAPAGFPETRRRLESLAIPILELDVSEARKMDGGLTCLSIRF